MYVKFQGTPSGLQSGDAITKIEIATKDGGEPADTALAAGRGVTITELAEITAFQNSGVVKNINLSEGIRQTGWKTLSINITGDTSASIKVDNFVLYSGTLSCATVRYIKLRLLAAYSATAVKTVYFSNLRKTINGTTTVLDDLTSVSVGTNGWSSVIMNGSISNVTFGGRTCLKLTSDTSGAGQVVIHKDLGGTSTGLYEIDMYDPGEPLWLGLFSVSTDTTFTTQSDAVDYYTEAVQLNSDGYNGRNGYGYRARTPYAIIYKSVGDIYTYSPAVKITESRQGISGEFPGSWVDSSSKLSVISQPVQLYPKKLYTPFTSTLSPYVVRSVGTPTTSSKGVGMMAVNVATTFIEYVIGSNITNFHISGTYEIETLGTVSLYLNVTNGYVSTTNVGSGYCCLLHGNGNTLRLREMTNGVNTDKLNIPYTYTGGSHTFDFTKVGSVISIYIDGFMCAGLDSVTSTIKDSTITNTTFSSFSSIILQGNGSSNFWVKDVRFSANVN